MKKWLILIIISIFFSPINNILVLNNSEYRTKDNLIQNETDKEIRNYINNDTITMSDIADFLEDKNEHYPFSDEFVEKYQQEDGGYIDNAKKAGLVVNKQLHEPNQKWHFFESWLYPSIEEGTLSWEESAQSRVYSKLQCPELLLWIYEACEVDPSKVKMAKDKAEEGKMQGLFTSSISKNMRTIVLWDDLKDSILSYVNSNLIKYAVNVNFSTDFVINGLANEYSENRNVQFTINVTNHLKTIDYVTINGQTLKEVSPNQYEFIMPKENVSIVINLKDKDPGDYIATNVSLNVNNLSLNLNGKSKTLIATVLPYDTMDIPTWSIKNGEDIISITPNNNECIISPLKEGKATVVVSYNNNVSASCEVVVNEVIAGKFVTVYNISSVTNKFNSKEDLFNSLIKEGEGEGIINSISGMNDYVYGRATGGRNDTYWSSDNLLKISSTSNIGSVTFDLNEKVTGIKITGFVHNSSIKIRIGDSSSLDWTDGQSDGKTILLEKTNMTVANKDTITANSVSSIEAKFTATDSVRIETTNKYPLYISSIEFLYV